MGNQWVFKTMEDGMINAHPRSITRTQHNHATLVSVWAAEIPEVRTYIASTSHHRVPKRNLRGGESLAAGATFQPMGPAQQQQIHAISVLVWNAGLPEVRAYLGGAASANCGRVPNAAKKPVLCAHVRVPCISL